MESFDFIRLVNCEDNEKYLKKGFNQISNISFTSIGVAVAFAYLYQVITTKQYRYGMQLFASIEELQPEDSYSSLKSNLFLPTNNFDISSSLFNLCSSPIIKDLQNFAFSYFPQESFLSIQRSLRKFSYQCNTLIIVYYKDQIIEFNHGDLPSKITIGLSIEDINRTSLLLFDNEPKLEIEFRYPEILLQVIEKSCKVFKSLDNQTILTENFEKYRGIVPDYLLEQLQEIANNKPKLLLKSAPKLGSLGKYEEDGLKRKKLRIIPLSCEETKNFLDKFMKHDSRFLRNKIEKDKFKALKVKAELNEEVKININSWEDESKSSSDYGNKGNNALNIFNLPESQPPDFYFQKVFNYPPSLNLENAPKIKIPSHKCKKCRDDPMQDIGLLHKCILCDQCHYESVLTKHCLRCEKEYSEKELEELKLYFSSD